MSALINTEFSKPSHKYTKSQAPVSFLKRVFNLLVDLKLKIEIHQGLQQIYYKTFAKFTFWTTDPQLECLTLRNHLKQFLMQKQIKQNNLYINSQYFLPNSSTDDCVVKSDKTDENLRFCPISPWFGDLKMIKNGFKNTASYLQNTIGKLDEVGEHLFSNFCVTCES